jgi:hypothetical protein
MDVPDLTPRGRGHVPRKQRLTLQSPVLDAPFKDIPPERPRKLPPSLLAPWYSHLPAAVSYRKPDIILIALDAARQSFSNGDAVHGLSMP